MGCFIFGALLIAKASASSFIAWLPISAAMLYLAVGVAFGPSRLELLKLDAFQNTLQWPAAASPFFSTRWLRPLKRQINDF